jgi:predicted dienelactone hydrolase
MFAGSRQIEVKDVAQGITFPALVLYPTEVPSAPIEIGPYTFDVSPGAPVTQGRFPLVVISHGNGGSHLLYRGIATHLAQHGYVVVMPEHHGNNRRDNALEGTDENLALRPRHAGLALDAVAAHDLFAAHVQRDNVAFIGHSIGGYTALAAAGGTPWTQAGKRVEVQRDTRIRALVLLAPATAWYMPQGSLRRVTAPILMLTAEHDAFTPPWQAELVLNGVPDRSRVAWRVVENAGHFSFLSPFPPSMKRPDFRPATDPPGFDRDAFHRQLPAEILVFLEKQMKQSLRISTLSPYDPQAAALMAAGDAFMIALYPDAGEHITGAAALAADSVLFVGGYVDDALVACGAVRICGDDNDGAGDGVYGDLRRMFVSEEHRGKGYAKEILRHLEAHLRERGVAVARLETGSRQPEAIEMYRRFGYVERGPFGKCVANEFSVFMEKRLA